MKRIILGVAVLLITFGFGVGVDRLIWARPEAITPIKPFIAEFKPVVEPVLTEAPVVPSSPESRIILDYDGETFYPNGTYHILGSTPREFAEFFSFEADYSDYSNDHPVGYISVNTKSGGGTFHSQPAVFGLITERRVFFITSPDPRTDFEYLFDGQFLRSDFNAVANKDKAVVRGTLTKIKHGKKIAERVLSFSMVQHGC